MDERKERKELTKVLGRDELNLVEMGVFSLGRRLPKKKLLITSWPPDPPQGAPYFTIAGHAQHGLPTAMALEVYLACMELSHIQGFRDRKVATSMYELLKLLGWSTNSGQSQKRLIHAFDQLVGVSITTNNFLDRRTRERLFLGFGIIDDYAFRSKHCWTSSILKGGEKGFFHWNEIFFSSSLELYNVKPLDREMFKSLKGDIAKFLYRYVDQKLYKPPHSHQIDIYELAYNKLGMTRYKYPSDVKKRLKPGMEELERKGIAELWFERSSTPSGWKLCMSKPQKVQKAIEHNQAEEAVKEFLRHTGQRGREPYKGEVEFAKEQLAEHGAENFRRMVWDAARKLNADDFLDRVKSFKIVKNYLSKKPWRSW